MPAKAAIRLPRIRTVHTTRSTRMPAARAASELPPIAYRARPWRSQASADPDGRGHAEPARAAEVREGAGHVDDRLALGDGDLEAPEQGEGAEGDDEAVEAQLQDEESVDGADGRAD